AFEGDGDGGVFGMVRVVPGDHALEAGRAFGVFGGGEGEIPSLVGGGLEMEGGGVGFIDLPGAGGLNGDVDRVFKRVVHVNVDEFGGWIAAEVDVAVVLNGAIVFPPGDGVERSA